MWTRREFFGAGGLGVAAAAGVLSSGGGSPVQAGTAYEESLERKAALPRLRRRMLGYPINLNSPPEEFLAWREQLRSVGIGEIAYNNVGNPFRESPLPFNTHDLERQAMLRLAPLYGLPPDDAWGFLSHSGTDSNMHGMYLGRTILRGRTGQLPKAYFTREAHYSVQILVDLLGLEAVDVATLPDGGMDGDDLVRQLARNGETPALVVPTIGTTFRGAIDDLDMIQSRLADRQAFVHLDAALFGGYLAHTKHRAMVAFGGGPEGLPRRYDSIAVSCHKFFGFPAPAGIFLTMQRHFDEFLEYFSRIHNPAYIHQVPGTITCSRDAVKPAEFYYYTSPEARVGQASDARAMLENAEFLERRLVEDFPDLHAQRANGLSNTVFFRCPPEELVRKYSLATMDITAEGRLEKHAHVVVMPHVTQEALEDFIADLKRVYAA